MDFQLIQSFLSLVETQNFSAAAQRVSRTQSALSLQIQKLEKIVGRRLFHRDNRNVILTSEGEIFLNYAKQMLDLYQEMKSRFLGLEAEGDIRFGAPEDFAALYLSPVLAKFASSYHKVGLKVNCDLSLNLLKGFEKGEFDLVLIKHQASLPNAHQVIREEPLGWMGVDNKKKQHLSGLEKGIPLILSPDPCVYRKIAIDQLNQQRISWRIVYTSSSLASTVAAVKAGLGITVLPLNMLQGGLKIISDKQLPALQKIQISLVKKENAGLAVQAFADHIIQQLTSPEAMRKSIDTY